MRSRGYHPSAEGTWGPRSVALGSREVWFAGAGAMEPAGEWAERMGELEGTGVDGVGRPLLLPLSSSLEAVRGFGKNGKTPVNPPNPSRSILLHLIAS